MRKLLVINKMEKQLAGSVISSPAGGCKGEKGGMTQSSSSVQDSDGGTFDQECRKKFISMLGIPGPTTGVLLRGEYVGGKMST